MIITFLEVIGIIVLAYFFMMYLLSLLTIPNLLFSRKPSQRLPREVLKHMKKLGEQKITKRQLLEKVIDFQLSRFSGGFGQTIFFVNTLEEISLEKLWKKGGYLHCFQHTWMLKRLLFATKRFSRNDFKPRFSSVYFEIHKYLLINISETEKKNWLLTDPFAMSSGFDLGEKLPFFMLEAVQKRGLKSRKINKTASILKK